MSRLRTTPVRKPRTECCCQPVAFTIAAKVAPRLDRSIASTLSRLVSRLAAPLTGDEAEPIGLALRCGAECEAVCRVEFVAPFGKAFLALVTKIS